jgi:hypothetical protein
MRTPLISGIALALALVGAFSARAAATDAGGANGRGIADGGATSAEVAAQPPKPFSLLAPLPGEVPPSRENESEYQLERADDGSGDLLYKASGFTARIHRDGSVAFHDKSSVQLLPLLPWMPLDTGPRGPTLEGVMFNLLGGRAGPAGRRRVLRDGTLHPSDDARMVIPAVTPFRPDPREGCRYPANCFFDAKIFLLSVAGTFDLTDALMRLHGKDPHRYQKARFLTQTYELRVRLTARAHGDDVRHAIATLEERLRAIAQNQSLTPAERRAIIRGLAAELDTATDEGRQARAQIENFERTHFPAPDGGS